MASANAHKVYDGPSMMDGKPIVVIMTGFKRASKNVKTDDMIQTWILRKDIAPHTAQKTGDDASICGKCPLRPLLHKVSPVADKPCYVKTWQAPLSTWRANKDKDVTPLAEVAELIKDRQVRWGSYGDAAAVPGFIWGPLKGRKGTNYTHQWETCDPELRYRTMASVHSLEERRRAKAKGFGTFRTIRSLDELTSGEVLFPASKEAGARTTCAKCNLCNGRKDNDKRKDIAIVSHR